MNLPLRPLLALALMSLLWGYGWVALKIGLIDAEPFSFTALRMTLSGLTLLLILRLSGRRVRPERIPELVVLALVQTSALFTLSTWAVAEGTPGRVAFLVYTMPFFTLLFAWLLLGERVRGGQWLSIVLAAAGLLAIIQPWHLYGSMTSNLLALAAGSAWALGAVLVKRLQRRERMDLLSMTTWQMLFGAVPLVLVAWSAPEAPIVWSGRFMVMLLLIAVVITALGWMLWMYALSELSAGTASLATLAAPPIAMLASAFHFGERPNLVEAAGMVLIVLALLALSLNAMRSDPSAAARR
ncbi:MAG: DMT family transporter [Gammaproteobacteria bacterium]